MNMTLTLISIPVVSALIGWVTNWLAVKMIFRPRRQINILGLRIQGLIPKRKSDLARKIGETVERELISHQDIHTIVTSPQFEEQILSAIISRVENFLFVSLGSNPLVAMALSGDAARRIKDKVRDELRKSLPGITEELFEQVEANLDFKEIIRTKIEGYDLGKLEEIVFSISSQELKAIELFGGILGFIIGLGQALFLIFMNNAKG